MLAALLERPVLAHPHRLGGAALALDVAAAAVDDVVTQLGLDPDDDPVAGVALLMPADSHVLNGRLTGGLHHVAPAAALEVVEPTLPLHQQRRRDQPAQSDAVIARPGELDVGEELCRRGPDGLWSEHRVLVGRLGRGQLDATLALSGRSPVASTLAAPGRPETHRHREAAGRDPPDRREREQKQKAQPVPDQSDIEQHPEEQEQYEGVPAAAAATTAPSAAAESGAAAAGGAECAGRGQQHDEHDRQRYEQCMAASIHIVPCSYAAAALSGPTPGSVWAMCWSAW